MRVLDGGGQGSPARGVAWWCRRCAYRATQMCASIPKDFLHELVLAEVDLGTRDGDQITSKTARAPT